MKDLKETLIKENSTGFYYKDYEDMKNSDDLIECLIEALKYSGFYTAVCNSINNGLDPNVFNDRKFKEKFAKKLSEIVEHYRHV